MWPIRLILTMNDPRFPNPLGGKPLFFTPKSQAKINARPSNVSSDAVPASCSSVITPACIQDLYGVPTTKATQSTNKIGVSGFIQQFANNNDLQVRDFRGKLCTLLTIYDIALPAEFASRPPR